MLNWGVQAPSPNYALAESQMLCSKVSVRSTPIAINLDLGIILRSRLLSEWRRCGALMLPAHCELIDGERYVACKTNDDGACGLHSIFGIMDTGEFECRDARLVAERLMSIGLPEIKRKCDHATCAAFETTLWSDFFLPSVETRLNPILYVCLLVVLLR